MLLNFLFGDGEPTHYSDSKDFGITYYVCGSYPYRDDGRERHPYQYQAMSKNKLGIWKLQTEWLASWQPLDRLSTLKAK